MSDSLPLDEVSETQPKENANRRSIPKHWIVLGLLVFAHAALGAYFILWLHLAESHDMVGPI